jgi:hypothetical protein
MDPEVTALVGAERHERTEDRTGYRHRTRLRSGDTRVGTVDLANPTVRPGTSVPALLQPRRQAEQACLTVIQEASVHRVSTRKVDDLAKGIGLEGLSKSAVSRIGADLDPLVAACRTRPLTTEYPYVWLDATDHQVRVDRRRVSQATVVAIGVTLEGERQGAGTGCRRVGGPRLVDGLPVQPGEARVGRRAAGHLGRAEGLKQAIGMVLSGPAWPRGRVPFMRNLLATVPQAMREPIAAIGRTIVAQPADASALTPLHKVSHGPAGAALSGSGAARGRRRSRPGAHTLSRRASAAAAPHQSAGAAEQGNPAPLERRGDRCERAGHDPAGGRNPARAGRGMGGRGATRFQSGVDETAARPRGGGPAGALAGDCVGQQELRLERTSISTT